MLFGKSYRKFFSARLWFLLLALSGVAQAEPLLNGISLHKELGRDQFWGALYTELLSSDAEVLLSSPVAKRMELKILAPEGMTLRRFSRMWIEGAAINNPSAVLMAQADNMVLFDGFFGGRFETNYHIVLSVVPGQGVDVVVNNTLLGNVPDDNFFALLLRSWLGRVPLSSGYRDDLLLMGDIDPNLRHRYLHLEPRLSRIAVVENWLKEKSTDPADEPEVTVAAAPALAPTPKPKIEDKPRVEKPAPIPVPAPIIVASTPPATQQPVKPEPVKKAVATIATQEKENAEEERATITSQTLLARQFYISEVLGTIYARVSYPRRAQQLQQAGSVKFNLVIDDQGNIKSLKPIETSDYVLLNKAAEEAVKDAAPFPPLPEVLASSELELFVPIKFSLGNPS